MQKLKGISSGQNNKSCRIIHQEPNKIGFTFFCNFLRNLQESATHFYYWSGAFAAGSLGRFLFSQCGPWARWPARGGQIPAMSRRSPAGEGRGAIYGSLGAVLWGWMGTRRLGGGVRRQPGLRPLRPCGGAAGARRSGQGAWQGRRGGGMHARERKAGPYKRACARRTAAADRRSLGVSTVVRGC
jgi:hypothetical protein